MLVLKEASVVSVLSKPGGGTMVVAVVVGNLTAVVRKRRNAGKSARLANRNRTNFYKSCCDINYGRTTTDSSVRPYKEDFGVFQGLHDRGQVASATHGSLGTDRTFMAEPAPQCGSYRSIERLGVLSVRQPLWRRHAPDIQQFGSPAQFELW
jgi:hypothetical protein